MTSMTELLDALNQIDENFPFCAWAWDSPPGGDAWGVVSADGARYEYAEGAHADRAITGSVDIFCRIAPAAYIEAVEAVLAASGMPWHLAAILYDRDTRSVHVSWDWETVAGIDGGAGA